MHDCGFIKENKWFRIRGKVKEDNFARELTISVYDMMIIEKEEKVITDEAPVKRVELHTHTKMSQMDGVLDEVALVKQAIKWGHKAVAITDHNGCQSFPHVYNEVRDYNKKNPGNPFKAI